MHEKKSGSISQCLDQGIGGKQIQVAHGRLFRVRW